MPSFCALPAAGARRNKMTARTFALSFIFHLPMQIAYNSIPAERAVGGNGPLGQRYIKRYESLAGTGRWMDGRDGELRARIACWGTLRHATARWREDSK